MSREYYDALQPFRKPRASDILYTLVGSFGIPVEVLSDDEFCVQRHIGILRPSKEIYTPFLARFMESRFCFQQAEACATGIAQKTVPLSGLRTIVVPLPPVAEQRRIVAKVDGLMALCDALKTRLADAAQTQRHLADAVTERSAA